MTGTATQKVEPDTVTAVFAVETVDEGAGDALEANSEAMDAVLVALEEEILVEFRADLTRDATDNARDRADAACRRARRGDYQRKVCHLV